MRHIMPLFTIYNISLRCPQNVSVRFQLKIPHISFIISFWKCQFWVEAETGCFRACLFKCKWAAASRPVCRIVLCLYRSYLGYSAKNICMVLIIMSIMLKLCVLSAHIWSTLKNEQLGFFHKLAEKSIPYKCNGLIFFTFSGSVHAPETQL